MKKIIVLTIILGLMLIGANIYAAGDLIVNGILGVGTASPSVNAKVDVDSSDMLFGLLAKLTDTAGTSSRRVLFSTLNTTAEGMTNFMIGGDYVVLIEGAANNNSATWSGATGAMAQKNQIQLRNTAHTGTYTINADLIGTDYNLNRGADNVRTYNIDDVKLVRTGFSDSGGGTGVVTITNGYGVMVEPPATTSEFNVTNAYGIYVGQQTGTTNSYGIALAGDGAGSDVVFGSSLDARIYSSGGELFVEDGGSNVTQISPHDPETGEWIYYSKNVKTGVVKRVDMERLVMAVEKLTGDTFMIETMEEVN
jgi:hypothetical protein